MKFLRLFPLFTALALAASAQTPPAAFTPPVAADPAVLAAPDVEAAYRPLALLTDMEHIMGLLSDAKGADRQMRVRQIMADALRIGAAFYTKYPHEPRRWIAVKNMADATRFLANDDGTPKAPVDGLVWDNAAWAAWIPQIKALEAQIATAPDSPPEFKFIAETQQPGSLKDIFAAVAKAQKEKQPVDFAPFKAELLRLAAKYPTVPMPGQFTSNYAGLRTKAGATRAEMVADLQDFLQSPSAVVRTAAQKEIEKLGLKDKPLDIAFTAVDGRKVDLKDHRGKVVLVDFWATWCGPCKAEIPNIKRVYAAYHDKGFEIVGVSLENAYLKPDDTPEQAAAKHEKAKQILTEFTTKTGMPWPQYYDGKFWKNNLSTRYDITSIPAMFLLDQDGKIVSTNARGPALEAEVKRLLKL